MRLIRPTAGILYRAAAANQHAALAPPANKIALERPAFAPLPQNLWRGEFPRLCSSAEQGAKTIEI